MRWPKRVKHKSISQNTNQFTRTQNNLDHVSCGGASIVILVDILSVDASVNILVATGLMLYRYLTDARPMLG